MIHNRNVDLLDQVFFHVHLDIISTVGLDVNDGVTVQQLQSNSPWRIQNPAGNISLLMFLL